MMNCPVGVEVIRFHFSFTRQWPL